MGVIAYTPASKLSLVANAGRFPGGIAADSKLWLLPIMHYGSFGLHRCPGKLYALRTTGGAYNLTFEADATLGVPPITLSGVNVTAEVTTTVQR